MAITGNPLLETNLWDSPACGSISRDKVLFLIVDFPAGQDLVRFLWISLVMSNCVFLSFYNNCGMVLALYLFCHAHTFWCSEVCYIPYNVSCAF